MAFKMVCRLHLLEAAVRQLDSTYLSLQRRFHSLLSTIKDSPLVRFEYREICKAEFWSEDVASTTQFSALVPKYANVMHQLRYAAGEAAIALQLHDVARAAQAMRVVDLFVDVAESRVLQLADAVAAFEQVAMFLSERGLLRSTPSTVRKAVDHADQRG